MALMDKHMRLTILLLASFLISCEAKITEVNGENELHKLSKQNQFYAEEREPCSNYSEERIPLFGDLHVHTSLSFDAAANTISASPTDAHEFAKGKPIPFWPLDENGTPVGKYALEQPLDFIAVTDHGEFLGERRLCREIGSPSYDTHFCEATRVSERQSMMMFGQVITTESPKRITEVCGDEGNMCREFALAPWEIIQKAADEAYDRSSNCNFTAFVAYEYTGTPGTSNYHRNVIFRNKNVPTLPVSYIEAPFDSLLWDKLDEACALENNCEYLTIPHNTNLSNGRMAPYMRIGKDLESRRNYGKTRQKREPIVEIFQHKGNSECINGLASILAPPDELCNFEAIKSIGKPKTYQRFVSAPGSANLVLGETTELIEECKGDFGDYGMIGAGCVHPTDFHRSGLLIGLKEQSETGINPVKLGAIGSTDTHTASPGAAVESNWRGHVTLESTPQERLKPGLLTSGIDGNPGGLAGVWARENSRDAIFSAMQRREVFGTSGTRIVPRFFAGWDFPKTICSSGNLAEIGYANGVPMGSDLPASTSVNNNPLFLAAASRDINSADLEEIQLIKGWIDKEGRMQNKILTIIKNSKGTTSLCGLYSDETFDQNELSYYYLRVLEAPTKRWSQYDCEKLPQDERPEICSDDSYPSSIQEMAWTSPIWFTPRQSNHAK